MLWGLTEIDVGKDYIFKPLPENYKLYEHVKGKRVGSRIFYFFFLKFNLAPAHDD